MCTKFLHLFVFLHHILNYYSKEKITNSYFTSYPRFLHYDENKLKMRSFTLIMCTFRCTDSH